MNVKVLSSSLIDNLEEKYGSLLETIWPEEFSFKDPFKNLIITVLSQNTSNANCIRAYKGLSARFEVTPEALASADIDDLKEAIRSGGLYNVKAERIKNLSKKILEKFNGDIASVLAKPKDEAKRKLMELPGIGEKTSDVLLTSRYSYQRVIPIDTHFDRVAKRLGIADPKADYRAVQDAWMKFLPEERRERLSGLVWLLAKNTCRSQNPKCSECPFSTICDFRQKKK